MVTILYVVWCFKISLCAWSCLYFRVAYSLGVYYACGGCRSGVWFVVVVIVVVRKLVGVSCELE